MAKKKKKINKKKNRTKEVSAFKRWLNNQQERLPIIKFVLALAVCMILFFAINSTDLFENAINLPIVLGYAWGGNAILNLFGIDTVTEGTHIIGNLFRMNIAKGCDAISPTVLFLAAVAVYPTAFSNKWKYLLLAPFAFAILNLARIISLYLLGAYAPSFFDFAHYEFWQGAFIIVTIIAWFYWLLSILNKDRIHEPA